MELELMNDNLNEDYLTRAKAAAYVLDRQEEVVMDVSQMQYLAKLLNVDELHYIDENGMIASASVSQYIGMDMADHEQTRPFLAILESEDEDAYLIQEAQPNAAAGKIMQYIGVARKNKGGFVQVGFEPKRLMEAQSRNTYDYIFARFPTDVGEEFFVVDCGTGTVLGHSEDISRDFGAAYYQLDELLQCTKGVYQLGADGNLDTTVSVGGNREFEELSRGINTMVTSIVNAWDRISAIIEISGISLAAFEYESGTNRVFVTSGLGALLDIPDQAVAEFCKNAKVFDSYIRRITETPIEGETDLAQNQIVLSDTETRTISASSGFAWTGDAASDITELLSRADEALYEVKRDTKGVYGEYRGTLSLLD